jgi:hypothetical protein
MSDTILSGDFTVYYKSENRQQRIAWSGTTGTYTVQQLYSALQDLFDESTQMDDSVPLSAQTPTSYTIGIIDSGETDPWFIDPITIQHLEGGSLETEGWTRAATTNTGLVKISVTSNTILTTDVGLDITHAAGDAGTLLYVGSDYLIVRPDSNAAANNFDSTSGTLTCNSHTATQAAAATSGKCIWSNIYTLGTLESNTELYVYQNQTATSQWWDTGHIDILVLTTDFGTLTDSGILVIYARQYSKLYDHFQVDVSTGGRTPIPLSTSEDINNQSGYYTLNGSSGVSDFDVGNYIYVGTNWSTATKKGIITAVSGTTTDPDIEYYLIGDLTNFATSDALKEYNPGTGADGDGTCTVDSVADAGPRTSPASTITVTFGGTTQDLSNGNGARPYSVLIDCQQTPLEDVYERLKYLTRAGETSDIDAGTQTITGQDYTAIGDYYLPYDTGSVDNPFTEGETITATGSFSCTLTSKHDQGTSEGFIIVRNVRGTIPVDNTTLTGSTSTHTALIDTDGGADPVTAISPVKQSPFGTFAGGKFFGARGVYLSDVAAADATSYELIDSEGVRQVPPNTVPIEVSGVVQNTQCYVYDSTPTSYLNASATTLVTGNIYKASTTLNYTIDIDVTIRAREMGYLPYEATGTITSTGLSVTAVWLVDPNWKMVVTGVNITFNENSPSADTIVRASGDFATDGWIAVMSQVTVEGSDSNDGTYEIGSISTDTITLANGEDLVQEGPSSGVTLTFTRRGLT